MRALLVAVVVAVLYGCEGGPAAVCIGETQRRDAATACPAVDAGADSQVLCLTPVPWSSLDTPHEDTSPDVTSD